MLLGDALAEFPTLLTLLGRCWFWLLTVSVLLVVLRGWPRAALASLFVGAHTGMFATMHIGIFAFVSIAALLVFYPPPVWNRVERELARPLSGLREVLEGPAWSPRIPRPSWSGRAVAGWRSIVVPLAAALAISSITVGNAALMESGDSDRWRMFAPDPPRASVWITMGATTASGAHVDAFPFREANVTADRPPDMAATYPDVRWGTYYLTIGDRDDRLKTALGAYVCRRWNATHDDPLMNVTVTRHVEPASLDDANPIRRDTVVAYDCTTNSRTAAG